MHQARATTQPAEEPLSRRQRRVRVADQLVDTLVKSGMEVVFGVPGGAIAPLHDALLDRPEVRVVSNRTEGGAMFAAAAYARASGKTGVVLVTSGPGATNCMTGLASAMCDGLPVLVIAGEVPRGVFSRGALQDGSAGTLNIVGMAKHVTKMAREIPSSGAAVPVLRRALATALSGRPGPTFITLPLDVALAEQHRIGMAANVEVRTGVNSPLVSKVAATLQAAERPLILAGSGVRWGDGPDALRALAERLQIPVATTPKAKGVFPESHPLSLGVFGHGGHPSAVSYLRAGVDVLLAVGTGLSDPATNGWSPLLTPTHHLIQIDVDGLQIGKHYEVTVGLVARADDALAELCQALDGASPRPRTYGLERHTDPLSIADGPSGRIAPQRALWELQQSLPANTLYVCDIGIHLLFATHYLIIDDPHGFGIMTGLASMGGGIAAAIGTQLARPDRQVCAIVGDGCFMVGLGDLATAARDEIPIVVAVMNDRRYGMVELGNQALYGRTPIYPSDDFDIPSTAASLGISGRVIEHAGDLASWVRPGDSSGPFVFDIRIDPAVRMPKPERFEDLRKTATPATPAGGETRLEVA